MNEKLQVVIEGSIAKVLINRPEKANALDRELWNGIGECFRGLDVNSQVRVCVLSGVGKHFCSGIDLQLLQEIGLQSEEIDCEGRKRDFLRREILLLQAAFNEIERCRKPVIAAVQGTCIGGGLDLISACDLRYSTKNVSFQIKEIDLGIVADMGSLQRLPALMPQGAVRELALTGRVFHGEEAYSLGLLNGCFKDRESLMISIQGIAQSISEKSPLVVSGIKENLLYARDHTVSESLSHVAAWNAAMLLSNDLEEAMTAMLQNRPPRFQD